MKNLYIQKSVTYIHSLKNKMNPHRPTTNFRKRMLPELQKPTPKSHTPKREVIFKREETWAHLNGVRKVLVGKDWLNIHKEKGYLIKE